MERYNPSQIEPKWQKLWLESEIYKAEDSSKKPKYVMLTEFPYPSGDGLHMGHGREYTLGDIMARYKRMHGLNVLYPMGFDAFGLPTENYAIKHKIRPQDATDKNVSNFQKQFNSLGYSIDWSRSFRTTDPDYYRWTQWLFLQFYKNGLAYQDDISINWCPKCKTGLANEEVSEGRHERCDTLVEKKQLKQWMLKITKYADKLIEGLDDVDYPSRIADQQINWIGKSIGAEIVFKVDAQDTEITVFTTRPDTLFGASYIALAPENELVTKIVTDENRVAVQKYIKKIGAKTEIERQEMTREKSGVFTGAHAIHPITGAPIPIWVTDYVLNNYGTGAIMAVPGHDERDYDFAQKFNLSIIKVIENGKGLPSVEEGVLVNSGDYNGLASEAAKKQITNELIRRNMGREKINYRLRDWIFSRQHYWGEPIPIIHCPHCGVVPVPEADLPVVLPEVDQYEPTDTGESPLASIDTWVNVKCPSCGGPAKRETDTMPNWAGSSWYYLRYFDAHNDEKFADENKLNYWGAVDMYLGGMEHTTLHLLYSRFWHKFFYDIGLVPTPEPYKARRGQGIVLAADGTKMSKSKGNVINPTDIIESGYGADALRTYVAFMAPYDMTTAWNPEGVPGAYRFINRVWNLVQEYKISKKPGIVPDSLIHKTIKKATVDLDKMGFNTAIASLMEYVNELYKLKTKGMTGENWDEAIRVLLKLIAPFAPHVAEELWSQIGEKFSIHLADWPDYEEDKLVDEQMTIAIQVNGRLRGEIKVPFDIDPELIKKLALEHENVLKFISSGEVSKIIYVPKKIVSIVVK